MSQFLTQTERAVLSDLNRVIDWYTDTGKEINHLLITKKQKAALDRIINKTKQGPVYDEYSEVEISVDKNLSSVNYKGVQLVPKETGRRARRKDTMDWVDK